MKLITKAIAKKLYDADLAVRKGLEPDEIAVKFFTPWAGASWFITSGTPLDGNGEPTTPDNAKDWHLFGWCDLGDPVFAELGYVMLSDLTSLRGPWGLRVERDMYYEGTLKGVMEKYRGAA